MRKLCRPHCASLGLLACAVLIGCGTLDQGAPSNRTPQPTPSIAAIFGEPSPNSPTPPTLTPTRTSTPTSQPAPARTPTAQSTGPLSADQLPAISIYGDKLNKNWTLANSQDMQYDVVNQTFVHDGRTAIAAQPKKPFSKLFFSVQKDSTESYSRSNVLGVRFWLSGDTHSIATSDIAVTVLGSNQYAYWNKADDSVHIDATITPEMPLFSETRLYDLGINATIPPKTWVEVVVWLDNLRFDPEYKYITGMYVKNDQGFSDEFYLDRVDLLLQP